MEDKSSDVDENMLDVDSEPRQEMLDDDMSTSGGKAF